jgi:hypothetical protein
MRTASLEGVEVLLKGFVARIVKHATDTDRALRGRGFPNSVQPYNSSGIHSSANAQILGTAEAHRHIANQSRLHPPPPPAQLSGLQQLEAWYGNNKALVWVIGLVVAVIGVVVKLFV